MSLVLGVHIGCTVNYRNMISEAQSIGANAFQFFTVNTCNKRTVKRIEAPDIHFFKESLEKGEIKNMLAHAPRILNLCSPYPSRYRFIESIKKDKSLISMVPGMMYVICPGNPLGQGKKAGIELLSRHLNICLDADMKSTLLLETSSGKRGAIGKSFGEILSVIQRLEHPEKVGICLDTSNVYAAGYDLVNNLDGVLEEFDKIIGLDRLKVVHLADHKGELGGMEDRHDSLGCGKIGYDAMIRIINHPLLKNLPFYLETPNYISTHKKEIDRLKKNYG